MRDLFDIISLRTVDVPHPVPSLVTLRFILSRCHNLFLFYLHMMLNNNYPMLTASSLARMINKWVGTELLKIQIYNICILLYFCEEDMFGILFLYYFHKILDFKKMLKVNLSLLLLDAPFKARHSRSPSISSPASSVTLLFSCLFPPVLQLHL